MMVGSTWQAKMKPKVLTSIRLPKMNLLPSLTKLSTFTKPWPMRVEHVLAARHQQHHRGEGDLQADAGGDQLPVDAAFVVRRQPRDADEHRQAKEAKGHLRNGFHSVLPDAAGNRQRCCYRSLVYAAAVTRTGSRCSGTSRCTRGFHCCISGSQPGPPIRLPTSRHTGTSPQGP